MYIAIQKNKILKKIITIEIFKNIFYIGIYKRHFISTRYYVKNTYIYIFKNTNNFETLSVQ